MSQTDFLVPLKEFGVVTRAVIEAISDYYAPRRIFIVSAAKEESLFRLLIPLWKVDKSRIYFIAEETYFTNIQIDLRDTISNDRIDIPLSDLLSEYDYNREGDQREPGWWIQQLIKLGAATQIPDLSEHYVVWDGKLLTRS